MNYNQLLLKNQLCFPLYASSKIVVGKYKKHLDKIGLTYTQYITMMVLWENDEISLSDLGNRLFLDSGTLTPLLKRLQQKGLITRNRNNIDERKITVYLTKKGMNLKEKAKDIPSKIANCFNLNQKESEELLVLLHKIIEGGKAKC